MKWSYTKTTPRQTLLSIIIHFADKVECLHDKKNGLIGRRGCVLQRQKQQHHNIHDTSTIFFVLCQKLCCSLTTPEIHSALSFQLKLYPQP
ncbi:CLUMA_CG006177, isoform A [Clunio marinus]|uniref:CLUMA_CG006177, isoform A n=1 Tax=Clunio marinus TaxID=568069 RepID=A0A1J1HX69_9DIPT|nr:CLUMA_CG006177, isoform A [Clunio marinus]